MKQILGLTAVISFAMFSPTSAEQRLYVAYPPQDHKTTSDRIFLIGTAAQEGDVSINGQVIPRSNAGHFAPTVPLQLGDNTFILRYRNQKIKLNIMRIATEAIPVESVSFLNDSLTPSENMAILPGELVCFSAIAPQKATVSVKLAGQTIPLSPQSQSLELPDNKAVLTGLNQPLKSEIVKHQGCGVIATNSTFFGEKQILDLGQPQYQLTLNNQTINQAATGQISILSPTQFEVAEVIVDEGNARTGPSTDNSRLTPLPKGTRARIIGRQGEFLRLDYGGWIKANETRITTDAIPPNSLIRSASSRQVGDWLEVSFPLQVAVPLTVKQEDQRLILTLYNTTAQTDTIRFNDNALISRMDWQPVLSPLGEESQNAVQYTFHFKTKQQWGYKLRYDGTTLVLSLKIPPQLQSNLPLSGLNILIDPGHGSKNDLGAKGPTGYPEKDVNLVVSKLLEAELIKRGASVFMTRKGDEDLYPQDRVKMINEQEPDLSISIHYNALPDNGDAIKTKGVSTFWYNPQAHSLAVFLQDYLVNQLNRPSYGVFWNNLALTRPTVAPSVLLELGFMINPDEFEWIVNPQEQQKLAITLADGIVEWVKLTQ
ncbi:N-acetylmuramoyl-L-alanine amidase [Planktothrix serta]|nr:N-acetylmuramoyl-L-alanine amidase [Planktothrix serta]